MNSCIGFASCWIVTLMCSNSAMLLNSENTALNSVDRSGQTVALLLEWLCLLFHSCKFVVICQKLLKISQDHFIHVMKWRFKFIFPLDSPKKTTCLGFSCWKPLFLFFMVWMYFQEIWVALKYHQIQAKWWGSCFSVVFSLGRNFLLFLLELRFLKT